jgi:ubiquinone/menaquinone biosynthesis C-methylase UbiE
MHTETMSIEELIKNVQHPAIFQSELKLKLDKFADNGGVKIVEVGCESGITSLILSDKFDKTLLDLNPLSIELAKKLFTHYDKTADFIIADMYDMPFANESYDIVFNAGVIEHFTRKEIIDALREYKRILKKDGIIFIGIPNQFSFPYKSAQIVRRVFRKWQFPHEYCYYNLKREIKTAGLVLENREVLSKESIYDWWNFAPAVKSFLKKSDKLFKWQGYLTLLTIRKRT